MQSNRIRKLRRARGWTQQQLAVRAHLAYRTISSVENGVPPQMSTRRKLCRVLRLPLDDHERIFGPLPDCRRHDYRP